MQVPGLTYFPWVGSEYSSINNWSGILIVAESVYDWDPGSSHSQTSLINAEFSRHVVYEHCLYFTCDGIKNSPTWRNLERALFGYKQISNQDRIDLWTSVSVHQHVQRPMISIQERPTFDDYLHGAHILKEILTILKPEMCIYLGTDQLKTDSLLELTNFLHIANDEKINGAIPRKLLFKDDENDTETPIIMLKHPSRFFSWEKWHLQIRKWEQ